MDPESVARVGCFLMSLTAGLACRTDCDCWSLPVQALQSPLRLKLLGQDLRQLALPPQQLWWDPRPHLLAVVPTEDGESLQMQLRNGQWRALAPAQQTILQIEPLGNGAGVALVSDDDEARQRVLLRALEQRALSARRPGLGDPQLGALEEA